MGYFFKIKPRKISPAGAFILLANHLNGTWDGGTLGRFLLNSLSNAWLLLRKVVLLRRKTLKRGNNMSTQALTGLRDYLYGTLSTNDMMWLVEELQNQNVMLQKDALEHTKKFLLNY